MRSSAHKNINNPPGQIVNKITKIDGTLQDYYERKGYVEPRKKLTFDEWWDKEGYSVTIKKNALWQAAEAAWNAGQENK